MATVKHQTAFRDCSPCSYTYSPGTRHRAKSVAGAQR